MCMAAGTKTELYKNKNQSFIKFNFSKSLTRTVKYYDVQDPDVCFRNET
jgi:hypothetical protein